MALKSVIENLDGLDAGISKLYVQKDGKFHLDIEADPTKKTEPPDNSGTWIPKDRFNQVIEQKKSAETALTEVVNGLKEDIPEEMRDLVPNLPPAEQIKWIRDAQKKGIFTKPAESGPDSKRPSGSAPKAFEGMSPQAIMATGYKTK